VELEKLGAVLGLGYAYAGYPRSMLAESLIPLVIDGNSTMECVSMAAISLGLIFVGTCNEEAAEAIIQALIERQSVDGLDVPIASMCAVGLGLLFLGRREACDAALAALEAVVHPIGKYTAITVEACAYACSGDVLKVQKMLQLCVERRDKTEDPEKASESQQDKDKSSKASGGEPYQMDQAVAVLAIVLIALNEDIGSEMVLRMLDHLLQYSELPIRRAVPLALALHSPSNPKPSVVDTLSKLSHDADADVSLHAIISLGIVGAGTNNSRIATLLRQLAVYYAKDSNALFIVRVSQGLLYMGKGLLTINPLHSDRFLYNPVALGGILTVLHACLFMKSTILGRQHYLLYHLVLAMYPRMLITVDENLNPLPVQVRVGQAVDVVGLAGHPKTITGFQTHTTPVLLTYTDRVELATDDYIPATEVMEGVVILTKKVEGA